MSTHKKNTIQWNMLKSILYISIFIFALPLRAADNSGVNSSLSSSTSTTVNCMVSPDIPNDGPNSIDAYANRIRMFFWTDALILDRIVSDWAAPSCVLDDGRPRLTALAAGYNDAFKPYMRNPDWQKSLARIEEIKKQFPNKGFVAVAEVEYWIAYAWDARGRGYASSVTPEGWKLFKQRLEKAENVLIETKPYAADLPIWYSQMMTVQSALGRPADERDKIFLEGTKKFKTYYPIYFNMLNYLLPKWGGSWETVDNMVKWSVDNTNDIDGNSMYARLYWSAYQSLTEGGNNFFKETPARWPQMKKGFEDLMLRHPKSKWNLNYYAKFACIAGDKKTYLTLRKQMGNDVIDQAWSQGTPLDLCEAKYGRVN